jgi:hypothetical protein
MSDFENRNGIVMGEVRHRRERIGQETSTMIGRIEAMYFWNIWDGKFGVRIVLERRQLLLAGAGFEWFMIL